MEIKGIDVLALNIMRLIFLCQALVAQAILPLVKDGDFAMKLDQMAMSGWMLFDDPGMLPAEKMEEVINMGRLLLMFMAIVLASEISDILRMAAGI